MPTAKAKGGSTSHRCRSASDYDDATLTQKREYWRTKKREQRARLTERRGKSRQDSGGGKLHLHAPAVLNSTLSDSFPAFSTPLQSNDESHKTVNISLASQSGKTMGDSSADAAESQKEKWLHTAKLNKVLPQLPASCSISVKAARGDTATVKSLTAKGAVSRAVTSPTTSGTQLNTCSSVPPVRVTTTTNGSSTKTAPQPCVSMQGASGPKIHHKAQVASRIQPKPQPINVSTGMTLSSPCVPVSIKTEGITATPQSGTKSALVTLRRAKGVRNPQPSPDTEDEKAAKRRENWRIKKREQRAKLAAQVAKARERTQSVELTLQRQTAQKTGLVGDNILQHLPSQSFLRGGGQKQRARPSFTSAKREIDKLQSGAASLTTINMRADQVKVQNPHGNRQTAITCDVMSARKPGELQRKLPNSVHLSYVSRGIARCKTPRQRFIEAQKFFMNQRNMRCKSPLLSSVFGTRNIPQIVISPDDTPEQIIAKRREYWRIKKREQRAKLSMEVKARLKEKDSLMRRVKRYQKILEEMRRARALAQSGGSTLTHASETIGGFIKEDGTVTINIPQVPTGHNIAACKSEVECRVVSNNTSITKPQHQPNTKRRAIAPIRVTQPPPPLRPAQVKVSFPLAGHSANKPPRLLSIRPRTQPESTTAPNSHKLAIQTLSQLTLTHPQTPQNAVSGGSAAVTNFGGCVMKMAVSSSVPSLSALSLDPELTEEERMAKKREYWRIKKREQRASRAARLKQGVLQARANATLQRRKAQRQAAVTTVPPGGSHTGSAQSLPNNSVPASPHANEIKHESESVPEVDLNSQPEQAICPDIKPPTSPPTPPPAPQPDPDPALNADSQATTLLAVASMKKLLEESLSTVTEYKSELTDVKKETTEEASEDDMTPNLPELNEVAPIAADLTLEIKSWQPDTDVLVLESSPNPHLKDSPQSSETPPSSPTSNQTVPNPTCEHSSQTPSNFILNPYMEASHSPSSPRRTQRLHTRKAGHQDCCSTESLKLHHLPMDQLQKPQCEQQCQAENSSSPSAQRYPSVVTEHSGLISLQRKREYWKLMKRQQRARLRARQKERHGECSSRLSSRNIQAPGLVSINTVKGVNPAEKPALQPKPPIASLTAVTSIPTVLVVSPSTCTAEESPDTLQVKLPVTSVSFSPRSEQNSMSVGPSQIISDYQGAHENQQQATPDSQKWMSRSTDVDSVPSLPTLTPPDNPLSSINLQPIEPPCQNLNSNLSPIKMPSALLQSPTHMTQSPPKLVPVTTMVPPKPIPGECEEDFLRRKREYWRIKKKEQRARKAIQDKGTIPRRASNNLRPILPAQDVQTRDSDQWVSHSSEESQHLMSTSEDTNPGTFPFPNFAAQVEDETELLFTDYENANGEEGPVSEAVWRNRYLMDYDPLNQLLVCMVCGELQYSHSLEGVRAHIDEAHPDTLTLEPREQQQILEAWDEQVSQRERFFTSQLQQHSEALAEEQRN